MQNLNLRAQQLVERAIAAADMVRIAVRKCPSGARLVDFGIEAKGGLEAGRMLAQISMAGLGWVEFVPADAELTSGPAILVTTDQPVAACIAAQYAGWRIAAEKYFAMGSGPMRAAAAREPLFDKMPLKEKTDVAVGVLETRQFPTPEVCRDIAEKCGVRPDRLTLCLAPTASQAGTLQVASRSVETALHKLLELGFDLTQIESGYGTAPLPPIAKDDLAAIGRTNDAILYGAQVTLWVRGDDAELEAVGRKVPSSASSDHGQPFIEIFKRAGGDFYQIDPHLFSPAVVTFMNLRTGNSFRFGHTVPRVIHESFGIGR